MSNIKVYIFVLVLLILNSTVSGTVRVMWLVCVYRVCKLNVDNYSVS